MRVVILYRPQSEHGRQVETFIREFQMTHQTKQLEIVDIDTREGAAMASLYDVMQYPTVLAVANDGSLVRSWEGESLPLMNELAYYTYEGA